MSDMNPGPSPEKVAGNPAGESVHPGTTRPIAPTDSHPAGASATLSDARHGDPLRGSRTSGVWIGLVAVAVLVVLLVVFTLQNTQQVDLAFLGWQGRLPLSAAILIAAAAGLLIAAVAGSLRILQLRRRVKRGR
jgi:uncharacterized integral membrane protein